MNEDFDSAILECTENRNGSSSSRMQSGSNKCACISRTLLTPRFQKALRDFHSRKCNHHTNFKIILKWVTVVIIIIGITLVVVIIVIVAAVMEGEEVVMMAIRVVQSS